MTAIGLALRLARWGILGFSVLAFVSTLIQALGFYQVAGHNAADRLAFARSIDILASQFTVLLAPPVRPDTVGGYVQYRAYGGLAILFAVWAMASAAGAFRGDEERGLVEAALATGTGRARLVASRVVAFALGSFLAAMAAGAALMVGVWSGGETIAFRGVLEEAAVLAALAVCCYALTLLVVQFTSARAAAAVAGIVLLALFLDNSLSRTFSWLSTARWASPFRYYELSQPLVPGGTFDGRATLILVGGALVASVVGAVAFGLRDVGSPLVRPLLRDRPPSYESSRVTWWRIPVLRGLYEHRLGIAAWTAGVAALAAVMVSMTKSIVQPLLDIPALARFFGSFVHGAVFASFLGFFWFTTAQLLLTAFAIVQVARWSADDSEGRLGEALSQPVSRAGVVIERTAALTVGVAIIAVVSAAAVGYASRAQGIDLDTTRLVEASMLLVPFTLVFAGVGALLAAWNPRAAVGLLGGIAFGSYLATQVGPFFRWPDWALDLSPFKLFGNPMSDGVDGRNLALMLLLALVCFGASILAIQRRDVGA